MPAQSIFRFRNPALLMALAAVFPVTATAAGDARIDFAVGNVTAVNAAGVQRPLSKGSEIGNGDTVRTGEGGRAQIRFSDDAMVSLQPETEFRIDDYRFSGKVDGQEKGFFSLLKGGLRTITGWVGRSNRESYRVTTTVATIGIRGTEYTAVLGKSGSELVVNTGEGMIEVCNTAGCLRLASGESGVVSGIKAPSRTDSRPQLPPAQVSESGVVYKKADDRGRDGNIPPVTAPLASGSQNFVSVAGLKGNPATAFNQWVTSGSAAAIDSSSLLTSFKASSDTYSATNTAGGFSADGIIGWGRWASGTYTPPTASTEAVKDMHYVVGVPTATSNFTNLAGISATYQVAGFTNPTSSTGLVGSAPSGSMTVTFAAAGTAIATLALLIPIGGTTQSLNEGLTANFGTSEITGTKANGFFAGANAPYAGLTYKFTGTGGVGDVTGAVVLKR